jgi:hypothetical protein
MSFSSSSDAEQEESYVRETAGNLERHISIEKGEKGVDNKN